MSELHQVRKFNIGELEIGNGHTFIIAEIGSNHNGKLGIAKELIREAKGCGADAVKFQSIKYDKLYQKTDIAEDTRIQEIPEDWYPELIKFCKSEKIYFSSSPTYSEAVDILQELNIDFFKLASPQTYGHPQLIEKIAKTNKPIIASTGYCKLSDIDRAFYLINKFNKKVALLHCVSQYPMKEDDANLEFIRTLKAIYDIPIGFSDHSPNILTSLAAVALGADIIEKHITLDKDSSGPDHAFALEPQEFGKMIGYIRLIEKTRGKDIKILTSDELHMREYIQMRSQDGINFKRDIEGKDAWEWHEKNTHSGSRLGTSSYNKKS